jgi:hypothetical protein
MLKLSKKIQEPTEKQQAWVLFRILMGLLLTSSAVYLISHIVIDKKFSNSLLSEDLNKTLVEIRSAEQLLKDPVDKNELAQIIEKLKKISPILQQNNQKSLITVIADGLTNEELNTAINQTQLQKYNDLLKLVEQEYLEAQKNKNTNSPPPGDIDKALTEIRSAKQLLEDPVDKDDLPQIIVGLKKISPIPQQNNQKSLIAVIADGLTNEEPNTVINPIQLQKYNDLLKLAEQEYLEAQENNLFFWNTRPLLLIEIAFWGWVGTILYLLSEIYTYYKQDDVTKQKFVKMTPWYFITLFRGTFVVFIIMLAATTVEIEIGLGTSLSLGTAPIQLLVFASGVLGYYNRVAKEQLELIVKGVFRQAWKLANPNDPTNDDQIPLSSLELKIEPPLIDLTHEQLQLFKVESEEEVTWTREPAIGTFNPTNGKETTFTVPTVEEAKDVTKITVIATSPKDSSRKGEAVINLSGVPGGGGNPEDLNIKNQQVASSWTEQPDIDSSNGASVPPVTVPGTPPDLIDGN